MKSVIDEIWYGNISPHIDCHKQTKEAKELRGYILAHYDKLCATLTDEQKELLVKFEDCETERTVITEREIFQYAFRLGARMAIEVMSFHAE